MPMRRATSASAVRETNGGTALREVPLLGCGVVGIESGGNDGAKDGIAQEF